MILLITRMLLYISVHANSNCGERGLHIISIYQAVSRSRYHRSNIAEQRVETAWAVFSKPPVCGHERLDSDSALVRVRFERKDSDSRQQVVENVSQGAAMKPRRVRKGRGEVANNEQDGSRTRSWHGSENVLTGVFRYNFRRCSIFMQIGSKHLVGPADWYSPRHAAHHFPPRFIVQNSAPHFYIDNHSGGRMKGEQRDKECGMGECCHDSDVMPVMVAYRSVWVGQRRALLLFQLPFSLLLLLYLYPSSFFSFD